MVNAANCKSHLAVLSARLMKRKNLIARAHTTCAHSLQDSTWRFDYLNKTESFALSQRHIVPAASTAAAAPFAPLSSFQYPSLISRDFLTALKDWLRKGLIATINRNLKLGSLTPPTCVPERCATALLFNVGSLAKTRITKERG